MKSAAVYQYLAVHLYFTIRQHGNDGDTEASCRCVRAESREQAAGSGFHSLTNGANRKHSLASTGN